MPLEIQLAYDDLETIRELFTEYKEMLSRDLTFQRDEEEFQNLPGSYALPYGRLYLARYDGQPAGCIALRPHSKSEGEIKRFFVRPSFRGKRVGRALAEKLIADAREMGYSAVLLDTLPSLENSVELYKKLGFCQIESYNGSPQPGTLYFRLNL